MLEEGERQIKMAQNRIKFQEVVVEKVEEDAISALPDCLLQEILSRLPSTKDAIKTVSGSPLLETLVFKHCNGHRKGRLNITSNEINAPNISSLTQCPQLKLKKFKVHSSFDIQFQSPLSSWIRYAIRCNVEVLKLDLWKTEWGDDFMLDQILFTSSCLTELRLYGCMINPIGAVSWKNLKSLCIIIRNLDEDLIENILCGSPVLESLVLHSCYGYKRLDITSKRVKSLVLSGFKFNIIEMNAPNILSLTIRGELLLSRFLLVNVSSLVKANLNWICTNGMNGFTMPNEAEQEMFKEFILKLGHVKELEIGFDCSKVISCLQAKGFVVPSNVKLTGIE